MGCTCTTLQKTVLAAALGITIAVIGAVLFPISTKIIHDQIVENIPLVNGSQGYENWKDPPVPVYMKFFVFDLQNKIDTLKGAKPIVKEKGPYVYREIRPRTHIQFHPNNTLSYRQPKSYVFVKELSHGSENDTFTTVNLALVTIGFQYQRLLSHLNSFEQKALAEVLNLAKEYMFKEFTVYDMIWGYKEPLLAGIVGKILRFFGVKVPEIIGIFASMNGTDDGLYNIYTGVGDVSKVNLIDEYNGSKNLSFWTTPYCNMVNGTDGSLYHPFVDKSETFYMFSSDICRSIYARFEEEKELMGINLYRFVPPPDVFGNVSVNPDNIGYCTPNKSYCLGAGLLNVTKCHQGAPVIISQPHFYQADPKYINAITGVKPKKEKSTEFIDIEPYTGAAMNVAKRLQINVYYRNYTGIEAMKFLPTTFYPIVWLQEGATLDTKTAGKFNQELGVPLKVLNVIKFSLIALGLVVALVAIIYGCSKGAFNKKSEEEALLINKSEENGVSPINT